MPRNRPPRRPRNFVIPMPNPGPGRINLRGHLETRISNKRSKVFNGVIRQDLAFNNIVAAFVANEDYVHEAVKGIFKKQPNLIHASPQQIVVEVFIQLSGGIRQCAKIGGTTVTGVRAMLERFIEWTPVSMILSAMSRMKWHDRDTGNDSVTKPDIDVWRENHGPTGDPDKRRATHAQTMWTGAAQSAASYVEKANNLRDAHGDDLVLAPKLKLVDADLKTCDELDHDYISSIFAPTME